MSAERWCWLALVDAAPPGAFAVAPLRGADGGAAGLLAVWHHDADHPDAAARVDARAIDPAGAPAQASLVLTPTDPAGRAGGLLFDDPAVSQAIRRVLQAQPADVVSTLSRGDAHFVGAITAVRDGDRARLLDDPFAVLYPARLVEVGAGLLGRTPTPVGPSMQRYGAGNPWPWDRFS